MVAATVVTSTLLFGGEADTAVTESHVRSQNRALIRETAEDGLSTVLEDAVNPTSRRWRPRLTLGDEFDVDGQRVVIDEYALEDDGQTAMIKLTAYRGGIAHHTEGRYRISDPDWPSPLWVSSPYVTAVVDDKAVVDGRDPQHGVRPIYFDATRFEAYRLGNVLSANDLQADFAGPLQGARGASTSFETVSDMGSVLRAHDTPTITELYGRALADFDPSRDIRRNGNHTVTGKERYGRYNNRRDPDSRVVVIGGSLTIPDKNELSGNGILIVEGDLVVEGKLRWDGLVLVMDDGRDPVNQKLLVDLAGDVTIRGGMIIDQESPPPGGHTDMTINRDMGGNWTYPYGCVGGGTPAQYKYGRTYEFFQHTHRIDKQIPETRTFYFAERGTDRHEEYTQFRRTLDDIDSRYPGEKVYVRFLNPQNHGAATFRMRVDGEDYAGSVGVGFGNRSRLGDSWASPAFDPDDLGDFVVDVRSLRLLRHLTDGTEGCDNRPRCVGASRDREGSLAVQIVRDRNDAVLYEASIYWHTHADGQPEAVQEAAADAAWRAAIRAGTANYGTEIRMGRKARLEYDVNRVAGITSRLGFNDLVIDHQGTFVEHLDVRRVHERAGYARPQSESPGRTPSRSVDD